jgi:hypothetical protein
MKKLLLILFVPLILICGPKPTNYKSVIAYKAPDFSIILDGRLTESVWQKEPVKEFTQRDPEEGKAPTQQTEVWVAYDENNIYVAARLNDSTPNLIDASLARRDSDFSSDWFAFYVDPYNDKKSGYYFAVNAGGSILDGILFNDSWDDSSWDGIWESKTNVDERGWTLEMRIPFSQLRFKENEQMIWGINFAREIKRSQERSYFVMVPKKESGFVSRFASLEGLTGIKPKQRVEILPYLVQKAQYLKHDANDPFYKSNQYKTTLGADFKVGLGSSLNLDATLNPDFGQVEVDPAVINLSAFESYFEEKRPFFIEGSSSFYFGIGGANNNWGFNFGWPDLFYSRRIGRSPQGAISSADYADYPTESRILGAAKLTGKIDDHTTIGAVAAVTERTYADLYNSGIQTEEEVEPLAYYGVIRAKRESENGMRALGVMGTIVSRDLSNPMLASRLAKNAFTFGFDGYTFLDEEKIYVISAAFAGSYAGGSKEFMQRLQKQPYRYYQRPDATFAKFDPSLEYLTGAYGRVMFNKQQGNFYVNAALGAMTPGFEFNDLGFQSMADRINGHLVIGYRWYEPDGLFRQKTIYVSHARSYDFEGNSISNFLWMNSNFQFENYWGFRISGNKSFETFSKSATRGGPLVIQPGEYVIGFNAYSDSREKIIGSIFSTYAEDKISGVFYEYGFDIEWRPNPQIQFSIGPSYLSNNDMRQWVGNFEDAAAVNTYGTRYVFAKLDQETIAGNIRLNWTFTPTISLQLFMQPLFAVGGYSNFKELAKPRTTDLIEYGKNGSSISYDRENDSYNVDPDGNGAAQSFSISNPDFNFKSLRGNAVLRWEAMPGSIFYFVWSHNQQNYDHPGQMEFKRDLTDLWNSEGDDVFMVKFSYWLDI